MALQPHLKDQVAHAYGVLSRGGNRPTRRAVAEKAGVSIGTVRKYWPERFTQDGGTAQNKGTA